MGEARNKVLFLLDRLLFHVEFLLTFLGLVLIFFLVFVGYSRYFLKMATPYEDEFSLLIHLWMINMGMSLVIRHGDHVSTSIFYDKILLHRRFGRLYKVLVELVKVSFLAIMLWYLYQTFPLLTRGVTEYLRWPFAAYYSAIAAGLLSMTIRYLIRLASIFLAR